MLFSYILLANEIYENFCQQFATIQENDTKESLELILNSGTHCYSKWFYLKLFVGCVLYCSKHHLKKTVWIQQQIESTVVTVGVYF